jgi:hypothetical protein
MLYIPSVICMPLKIVPTSQLWVSDFGPKRDSVTKNMCQKRLLGDAFDLKIAPLTCLKFIRSSVLHWKSVKSSGILRMTIASP